MFYKKHKHGNIIIQNQIYSNYKSGQKNAQIFHYFYSDIVIDSPKEVKDFIKDETFIRYLHSCDFKSLSSVLHCKKVISDEQLDKLQNSSRREAADNLYTFLVGDPSAKKLRKLAKVLKTKSAGHDCHKHLAQYIETRFPAKGRILCIKLCVLSFPNLKFLLSFNVHNTYRCL